VITQFYLPWITSDNCLHSPSARGRSTHFDYSRTMVSLSSSRMFGFIQRKISRTGPVIDTVTHPSTNRARHRLTSSIWCKLRHYVTPPNLWNTVNIVHRLTFIVFRRDTVAFSFTLTLAIKASRDFMAWTSCQHAHNVFQSQSQQLFLPVSLFC